MVASAGSSAGVQAVTLYNPFPFRPSMTNRAKKILKEECLKKQVKVQAEIRYNMRTRLHTPHATVHSSLV